MQPLSLKKKIMSNYPNFMKFKGESYRDIPPADVKDRVERYIKRTRHTTPQQLSEPWKGLVMYTLVEYCEWDLVDVAEYLQVTERTVKTKFDYAKTMFRMATFTSKITSNGSKFVRDLGYYIYYNIHRR